MNKLIIILAALILAFAGVWFFKSTTPTERNIEVEFNEDEGKWWDTTKLSNIKTDDDWILDPEIPVNYIPVIDQTETYMVLNDDGSINRYRKRELNADGAWVWSDIIEDEMPVAFKPVDNLDNVYSIDMDGTEELFKYIRNGDGSYAYVPVDENGEYIDYNTPHGDYVPSNFVSVDGNNLYAAINEYGVIIEFWEKTTDEMGAITWRVVTREYQNPTSGVTSPYDNRTASNNNNSLLFPVVTTPSTSQENVTPTGITLLAGQTYDIETITENKTVGGWKTTYETTYTYVYNADGSLYSTYKDGPHEIETVQVFEQDADLSADKGAIELNIDAEAIRVSNGLEYKNDISSDVLAKLNSARTSSGLNALVSTQNGNATKLATIFAADMAKYNYADIESPLYGSIDELAKRYNINKEVSINVWRCGEKTADEINTRFQTMDSTNSVRMDVNASEVGIAIVANNGFYYVVEVFTN